MPTYPFADSFLCVYAHPTAHAGDAAAFILSSGRRSALSKLSQQLTYGALDAAAGLKDDPAHQAIAFLTTCTCIRLQLQSGSDGAEDDDLKASTATVCFEF